MHSTGPRGNVLPSFNVQGYNANVRNIKCSPSVLMYVFADSWYDRYTQHEIDQRLDTIQQQPASPLTLRIAARVLFRKVADGAGHLPDHFDLSQVYSSVPATAVEKRRAVATNRFGWHMQFGVTSYVHGCIWFDHVNPLDRGYGDVAAGRFKSKSGIYLVGKVRLTDWRPVREECDHHDDQNTRSDQPEDEYDSEEEEDEVRRPGGSCCVALQAV